MATSDLSSKSLGDIFLESGYGKPDHTAPKGSIYSDINGGTIYHNMSGNTWEALSSVSYGEAFYQNNTTETSIANSSIWYPVENNFTEGDTNGFSVSTYTMVLDTNLGGTYHVIGNVTIDHVNGSNRYQCGVSVNGNAPQASAFNEATVDSTIVTAHIGINTYLNLNGGDDLRFAIGSLDSADNIIVKHAQLLTRRIS